MPSSLAQPLLLLHAFATLSLTGLIWFVQVVHYPLMGLVGAGRFAAYERRHTRRTTAVVAPLMLLEAATAALLLAVATEAAAVALAWTGIAFLAIVWLSTALLQVPCHRRLEAGFEPAVHARLVRTNWLRTAAWSARSFVALALLTAGTVG